MEKLKKINIFFIKKKEKLQVKCIYNMKGIPHKKKKTTFKP